MSTMFSICFILLFFFICGMSYMKPGGMSYMKPGGMSYMKPGGMSYMKPGGMSYMKPGGLSYMKPGGMSYMKPGGMSYMKPGGISYTKPGGMSYTKPGGMSYTKPGGMSYMKPGGMSYMKPSGMSDTKPGGMSYTKPGGTSDMKPGRLNSAEIQSILKSHNYYRGLQKSSNMNLLKWNDDLAEMAHNYLQQCLFKHGQPRTPTSPFDQTGQNIHVEMPWKKVNYTRVVQKWYEEIKFYDYKSNRCLRMCGHYTQVVWADTKYVGCASKDCLRLKPGGAKATMTICNYGPAGNFQGKRPYEYGPSCRMCPKGSRCKDGLCDSGP